MAASVTMTVSACLPIGRVSTSERVPGNLGVVKINVGRTVLVVLALAGIAAAAVISVVPFRDGRFGCGTPLVASVHGKVIGPVGPGGRLAVLTQQQQHELAAANPGLIGLSGNRLPNGVGFESVVCRTPARHRLATAAVALGVSMIMLGVAWQLLDPRRRSAPVSVA
jgi:hypothetical protein